MHNVNLFSADRRYIFYSTHGVLTVNIPILNPFQLVFNKNLRISKTCAAFSHSSVFSNNFPAMSSIYRKRHGDNCLIEHSVRRRLIESNTRFTLFHLPTVIFVNQKIFVEDL